MVELTRRELLAASAAAAIASAPLVSAFAGERRPKPSPAPPADPYAHDELPLQGTSVSCSCSGGPRGMPGGWPAARF